MEKIVKMLAEEIRAETELRQKLLRRLKLLDAYSRYRLGVGVRGGIIMEEKKVLNVTEKPNSYEFGKAGNRFKVYFDNQEDGRKTINSCKDLADYKEQKFGGDKDE